MSLIAVTLKLLHRTLCEGVAQKFVKTPPGYFSEFQVKFQHAHFQSKRVNKVKDVNFIDEYTVKVL